MKEKMYNMLSMVEVMDNEEIWISIEGEASSYIDRRNFRALYEERAKSTLFILSVKRVSIPRKKRSSQ